MHTICPECSSVFRITAEQLNMAHGQVRCGFCDTVFNSLGHLEEDWTEKLPEHNETIEHELVFTEEDIESFNEELVGSTEPPKVYQDDEEFPLNEIMAQPEPSDDDENDAKPYVATQTEDLFDEIEIDSEPLNDQIYDQIEEAPGILRDELEIVMSNKSTSKTALWVVGILLLILLLAFQVIYIKREDIAKQEEYRGLMVSMCEILSCKIPLRNDASKGKETLLIQDHAINKIKNHPDQLRIKAIFSNAATYTQAYPILSIKLSDHNNNITAMRRFFPEEYLAKHINIDAGLPAKTAVEVIVDILEPSIPVSSYKFEFY